jgi:hypothetical protein
MRRFGTNYDGRLIVVVIVIMFVAVLAVAVTDSYSDRHLNPDEVRRVRELLRNQPVNQHGS